MNGIAGSSGLVSLVLGDFLGAVIVVLDGYDSDGARENFRVGVCNTE